VLISAKEAGSGVVTGVVVGTSPSNTSPVTACTATPAGSGLPKHPNGIGRVGGCDGLGRVKVVPPSPR
jgi:hypothetical protein